MPIKIQIAKLPEIVKRERLLISPQEKFNRLSRRLKNKGSKFKLRKYHFNVINSGKLITVFDGEGIQVFQGENSVKECRIARAKCLAMFMSAENDNGGFNWTTNFNYEHQTLEELSQSRALVQKNLDYKGMTMCKDCKFQFQDDAEMRLHLCTENWMIFQFYLPKIS